MSDAPLIFPEKQMVLSPAGVVLPFRRTGCASVGDVPGTGRLADDALIWCRLRHWRLPCIRQQADDSGCGKTGPEPVVNIDDGQAG